MEAVLKFVLPEDEDQFRDCQDGHKWKSVVQDMDEFMRGKIKHGHDFKSIEEALAAVRQRIHDIAEEYSVRL